MDWKRDGPKCNELSKNVKVNRYQLILTAESNGHTNKQVQQRPCSYCSMKYAPFYSEKRPKLFENRIENGKETH